MDEITSLILTLDTHEFKAAPTKNDFDCKMRLLGIGNVANEFMNVYLIQYFATKKESGYLIEPQTETKHFDSKLEAVRYMVDRFGKFEEEAQIKYNEIVK